MTVQQFSEVFERLAVQLRTDADEPMIRGYFEALHGLSFEAVEASAQTLAKEPGRRFFPTSAEWYQVAQQSTIEALRRAIPAGRDEPWHHSCDLCEDTGWEPFECAGDWTCGRKFPHAAHHYVRACPCRPVNQTWQRHNRFGHGA